jgi:TrmH family RNA methyltransferase
VEPIRSLRNPALQRVRALQRTSERRAQGLFAVEGEDHVEAAIRAGAVLEDLLVREGAPAPAGVRVEPLVVAAEAMDRVSGVASGSRVIAVVRTDSLPQPPAALAGVGLVLCGVSDPGNVGTLLRTAAAFAAEVVVLGAPSADPTAPKAVRAATGATFAVPTLAVEDPADAYPDVRLVALDGAAEVDLAGVDLTGPVLIALGAERDGLAGSVRERAQVVCRIPQSAAAESLNVAAAGAIALSRAFRP